MLEGFCTQDVNYFTNFDPHIKTVWKLSAKVKIWTSREIENYKIKCWGTLWFAMPCPVFSLFYFAMANEQITSHLKNSSAETASLWAKIWIWKFQYFTPSFVMFTYCTIMLIPSLRASSVYDHFISLNTKQPLQFIHQQLLSMNNCYVRNRDPLHLLMMLPAGAPPFSIYPIFVSSSDLVHHRRK